MTERLRGKIYSISLTGEASKLLRGWYLLVEEDGREFIVERHLGICFYYSQRVYQSGHSFSSSIVEPRELMQRQQRKIAFKYVSGAALGRVIYGIFRPFFSLDLWFGESNTPFSLWVGLLNIVLFLGVVLLLARLLVWYRRYKLRSFLKRVGKEMYLTGKVKSTSPLKWKRTGLELW